MKTLYLREIVIDNMITIFVLYYFTLIDQIFGCVEGFHSITQKWHFYLHETQKGHENDTKWLSKDEK